MMIPLRRALIVDQHGLLKYPEGTACAAVLKAAEQPNAAVAPEDKEAARSGKTIFSGFAIGFIYYVLDKALSFWREIPEKIFGPPFKGGSVGVEINPMIRWLVDRWLRRTKFRDHDLSEEQLVAEGDRSSGVLLASGYIAGGALAGIIIAFMQGMPSLVPINNAIDQWQNTHNPFVAGAYADLLALIPFAALCVLLYLVGRDLLLTPRAKIRD
jgi:uncharacterized oligopeptide transporter (OPT) family protein